MINVSFWFDRSKWLQVGSGRLDVRGREIVVQTNTDEPTEAAANPCSSVFIRG